MLFFCAAADHPKVPHYCRVLVVLPMLNVVILAVGRTSGHLCNCIWFLGLYWHL